jgi:uncharacterized protein DUF4154
MHRRTFWQWTLALAAGLGIVELCGAATALEYQVKAAFVYKFATYVRWPASAEAGVTTPFVIGVVGVDPFGTALNEVMRNQRVQGRAIRIQKLGRVEEAPRCDLLFISASEDGNLDEILTALRRAPVLTVGDMEQFAERGGMIGLFTEDNHIRFKINKGAVERAGLKAPSQLLQLARIVDDDRRDREEH